MNRELWDHQKEALNALRTTVASGIKRIVLSAPTGSGKTLLSAAIIERAREKDNRVCFVVSSIALVDQTVEALYGEGIRDIGVIQANHMDTDWSRPVQVASIQTIHRRGKYPEAQVVIIDECHALHRSHKDWLTHEDWKDVPFIGLSATPYTKGLGKYFQTMITVASTQEMIDKGVLSPFKVFATGHPDLRNVKTLAGDYHEGQLSEAMQEGNLSADIVKTWQKHWNKDKTLCFGVDCAHAQALQERFIAAGITCGYQDARTLPEERAEIKRKFHNGEYQVVTNVGTLTTGVDWDCRCLILARPTKSEMLYQQIIGRALRTAHGKEYALILDHSDTTQRLGFVTDIYHESLSDGKEISREPQIPKERLPKECKACSALKPVGIKKCPNCGFEPEISSDIFERDGELQEIKRGQLPIKLIGGGSKNWTMEEKGQFLAELKRYGLDLGRKPGAAAWSYKEKFGVWPDYSIKNIAPSNNVSTLTAQWIRSRQIAYAKSRKKENV